MNVETGVEPRPAQPLANTLSEISNAQLIRHAEEAEYAFWFKHALVQDTAYASLMRHDRKRLHRLVAETLERIYPERLNELSPRLAEHYQEGGETARALAYYQRAAENAADRYANREALLFYTSALDAAEELQTGTRDSLYRARGVVHERIGKFDEACADLEKALQLARQTGDAHAEWQSLMELGFAWTARDYARAREYFENALELARTSNDAARLAQTLNRVGNWYVNNDEPQRAAQYHHEALEMFKTLRDVRGTAETQDLLAMMNFLGGDYIAAYGHARTAITQFETLGDPFAVISATIPSYLIYALFQGDTLPILEAWSERRLEEKLAHVMQQTRQLGWRAGQVFGLVVLGEGFLVDGRYGRALELLQQGRALAREINHRQWLAATTLLYGNALAQLLNFESAVPFLQDALTLARELGSIYWTHIGCGFLASAWIAQNELTRAQDILDGAFHPNMPAQTTGQRQVWAARVELALAQNRPDAALDMLDLLLRDTSNLPPDAVIPRLWLLRARALMQMPQPGAVTTAEHLLAAAQTEAQTTRQPAWEWRIGAMLAQLYRAQGRAAEAEQNANTAQAVVQELAENVPDTTVRETFLRRAQKMIWDA